MRLAQIVTLPLILVLLVCTVAWLSPLPAQPSPQTLNLTFTTIDVPGAKYTGVWGINTAGDMVGNYGQDTNGASHGFKYSNGTFTYFDYPGQTETIPTGINDSGLIVGSAGDLTVVGFVYDGTTFTTIKRGSDSATFVDGINNAGELVGGTGTVYSTKGFALLGSRFQFLNASGLNIYVYGNGVNNFGTIVGWRLDTERHGFLCRRGACQDLDFPGAVETSAIGINDGGLVVGWYNPGSANDYAFVRKNGKYFSFSYPGALGTYADGINASGEIVGQYTFDDVKWHGFVTNPIADADLH